MQVKAHALPPKHAMIGGLAADPIRGCVWLGMAGTRRFVWRFELDGSRLVEENVGGLLDGYSYIHRSLVPAPDGHMYVGATWFAPVRPGAGPPMPFTPGAFSKLIGAMSWLGALITSHRIVRREKDGRWTRVRDGRYPSFDLAWDPNANRLLKLNPNGVHASDGVSESSVVKTTGFVHELNVGPAGEIVTSDAGGTVWLDSPATERKSLGQLGDSGGGEKAAPGIDGIIASGRYLIGGTRNRARPFIVDLQTREMTVLPDLPTAPRASALAATLDGQVYVAAGVGRVNLYRLDPAAGTVEDLGRIATDSFDCHHVHDLAATPDGRLFAGEFYPLDVPNPPWPNRSCMLWEISL